MKLRTTLIATVLMAAASAPMFAQEVKACTPENMQMVTDIVTAADDAVKEAAMTELNLATERLGQGEEDACSVHLTNAANLVTGG